MKINKQTKQCALAISLAFACAAGPPMAWSNTFGEASDSGRFAGRPFRVSADIRHGWDSNVGTSPFFEQDSMFTSGGLSLDTTVGGRRTFMALGLSGSYNYYWDIESADSDDWSARVDLSITHRYNRRLTLSFKTYTPYQVEPDFNDSLTNSRRNGQYLYSNNVFTASYQWTNKLSTVTRYSLVFVKYEDSLVGATEDRLEQYASQEFRYLILPTTVLVGEYRYAWIEYDVNDRNSTSHMLLGGVDHNFTPRLLGSIRGGIEIREWDDGRSETKPYGEATLSFAYAKGSSLQWTSRYGYEQSDLIGENSTNVTLRTGLRVRHRLTARMNLNLGAYYQNSQFAGRTGGDATDDLLNFDAGFAFAIHRNLSLTAGYSYTTLMSDQPLREYDRQRIYLGLGATF